MENIHSEKLVAHNKPAILSLFVFIFLLIGATIIAYQLGDYFLRTTAGISSGEILSLADEEALEPGIKYAILFYQGITSFVIFIVVALLFFLFYNKVNLPLLVSTRYRQGYPYLLTGAILFCFFIVNSLFIEINSQMTMPESMAEVESALKALEEELAAFTKLLTQFHSPLYFVATVIVIAVLPAVGEELIFRGILQNIIRRMAGNYHVAIWLAAILFSAIHMQFYGFLPRMILGALFGYLYVWSGNLLLPILAHFLNNAISLILLYAAQKHLTDIDVESPESFPFAIVVPFAVLTGYLLYMFYQYFRKTKAADGELG